MHTVNRTSPNWRRLMAGTVVAGVAACEDPLPSEAGGEPSAARAATRGSLAGSALIVGNLNFGPTDAIVRYDGRGNFVDLMVAQGESGVLVTCCMTFGPDENLYVADAPNGRVLRFNGVTGEFMDEFISAGSGGLMGPLVMLFHGSYLYVGDTFEAAMRRYDATTGAFVDVFIPPGDRGMRLFDLQHFAFGPDGKLYVAAEGTNRLLRYDATTGAFLDEFITASSGFAGPSGVTFGPDGGLYVGSVGLSEIRRYDIASGAYTVLVPAGSGGLDTPVGITFGPDGNLYVASAGTVGTGQILRYDGRTGAFLGVFIDAGAGGLTGPRMLMFKSTVTICHQPPGNPGKSKTLTIDYLSGGGHVAHGDPLGACR